ncbi:fish-egg lectin-like [Sebastes umbrosus]|uniref:fish-egg lectin-like n=1 Tax=Sebastes umbrosus TaxID=72105 RepID=UPI0018A0A0E7|nr:fish-egg lectin-like [Sebastes umbrosus]
MKAVAVFALVLCGLAVSHAGWKCKEGPRLSRAWQIDASVGVVCATTRNFYAYTLNNGRWTRLSTVRVKHCSVGHSGIWAVGTRNQVYRYVCGKLRRARGTSIKQLDCGGDSHLVGATSANVGQCLRRRRTLGFAGTGRVSWQTIHSTLKFKHITCSPRACWAVTTGHRILCSKRVNPNTCRFSAWKSVTGSLVNIEISTDGRVFGVNRQGHVYMRSGIRRNRPHGTSWRYIPMCMAIKQVSFDLGKLWAVSRSGTILMCNV